jgi:lipopolysaccharide/colanic/teichoic acid biosynthesis glycosyltransferase
MAVAYSGTNTEEVATPELVTVRDDAASEWITFLATSMHTSLPRWLYVLCIKRGCDVLVSGMALLVLSPLLLLVSLVIRLDSRGPALFRQTRIGRGGRAFTIYKFRTMEYEPGHELSLFKDDDGVWKHKIKNDPRVTRAGRLLRRTSIDELPQLINILFGQMSLVGPRPELPQIVGKYQPWQHQRHLVRPGLTGWWQVSGRSDRPMHEHTELDMFYVENVSCGLDIRILWKTLRVVLSGFGAF